MQPQIPTPAKFFFIILTHPHLGGVISPSRALRDPTTAPKQPDIPPKMTHFPYHVFKRLKWCHATTNTHTSHIFLHHTKSSISGKGKILIQGPQDPTTALKQPDITSKMTHFPIVFLNGYGDVMQPQIPKPALFLFIILPHPHLGGVIFLSRALRAPTTTPKPRDISPKMTHFPIMFSNG